MKKVMTTGTFDILHIGHIKLLERAKQKGDFLLVGLNSDNCVAKSGKITAYDYNQRKEMLESIKFVDKVVPINQQEDKFTILQDEKIDIFAIGSDYKGFSDIPDIEKYAKVEFIERTPDVSTTRAKAIVNSNKSDNTKYNTLVIDIDDTISFTKNRDFVNSIPNKKIIDKINYLKKQGWYIILLTARGAKSCGTDIEKIKAKYFDVTTKWLKNNGVSYDELRFGKPNADWYVDDKNMSIDTFIDYKFPDIENKNKQ